MRSYHSLFFKSSLRNKPISAYTFIENNKIQIHTKDNFLDVILFDTMSVNVEVQYRFIHLYCQDMFFCEFICHQFIHHQQLGYTCTSSFHQHTMCPISFNTSTSKRKNYVWYVPIQPNLSVKSSNLTSPYSSWNDN